MRNVANQILKILFIVLRHEVNREQNDTALHFGLKLSEGTNVMHQGVVNGTQAVYE